MSSPSNASGYLDHPLTSREVFCVRLPGKDVGASCYVCAGDRGVVVRGAERYLYVIGRSADVLALDVDGDQRVRARLRLPTQHHAAPSTPLTTARRPHHLPVAKLSGVLEGANTPLSDTPPPLVLYVTRLGRQQTGAH